MIYDIYLYTLCYYICCLLGACMRCTRLCPLKPGVTGRRPSIRLARARLRQIRQGCPENREGTPAFNARTYPTQRQRRTLADKTAITSGATL
jgi:predicted RNase H-like nuclease